MLVRAKRWVSSPKFHILEITVDPWRVDVISDRDCELNCNRTNICILFPLLLVRGLPWIEHLYTRLVHHDEKPTLTRGAPFHSSIHQRDQSSAVSYRTGEALTRSDDLTTSPAYQLHSRCRIVLLTMDLTLWLTTKDRKISTRPSYFKHQMSPRRSAMIASDR